MEKSAYRRHHGTEIALVRVLMSLLLIGITVKGYSSFNSDAWIINNKLKLNDRKTEFLMFKSSLIKSHLNKLYLVVGVDEHHHHQLLRTLE